MGGWTVMSVHDLKRLRGVGDIIAARLAEAGFDTFKKVVTAGEEGLRTIRGVNPRARSSILSQAAELAVEAVRDEEKAVQELRSRISCLSGRVQEIALQMKERFGGELACEMGRKAEKDLLSILRLLDAASARIGARDRKIARWVFRAEKRLPSPDGIELKQIRKGLKRVRKTLENA
jgi:hypothetical protein